MLKEAIKAVDMAERGWLPDSVIRMGIRSRLKKKLEIEGEAFNASGQAYIENLVSELMNSPVALATDIANEQHYELPPDFFELVLGKHNKYSSGFWNRGVRDIDIAEADMLALTCERAELEDNIDILELGCGWGSLTFWMAEHYPNSRISAISNSDDQINYIQNKAARLGLRNIVAKRADINEFTTNERYDRVVSVEMFEHVRNYRVLLNRISGWLRDEGKLFVHIFSHHSYAYPYVAESEDDWMSNLFFTGGLMPSEGLFSFFKDDMTIEQQWRVEGLHYAKTCRAWLDNLDRERDRVAEIFRETYGFDDAPRWTQRWRIFFMACEELFSYNNGKEWFVSHYLFRKKEDISK
ncbi:class I SAM-dependent methyltransferase [bacterium]|nr:class I SAM-dependent methyltransferase [bacterium]